MAVRRKDNKGRNLWDNESQRKDGRYEYKYVDSTGKRRSVYSWKLVETDKVPAGKRCDKCLRDIEAQLSKEISDGLDGYQARHKTLNEAFDESIQMRNLKESTRVNYKYMFNNYVKGCLGSRTLDSIKYTDIVKLYNTLINEKGFKPNSMEIVHTILHPIFDAAVRDDIIRKNPTDGVMTAIKKSNAWDKSKRHALTKGQQSAFLTAIRTSEQYSHWMPIFTVLLGTGCRVGEIIGLRWEDCDFDNNCIKINHNLIYRKEDTAEGKCAYHITTPKTKAGIRIIPMLDEVKDALQTEKERQMIYGANKDMIDGYSGFVFTNRNGHVFNPESLNRAISRISDNYNALEKAVAESEGREPELIPHFSVHNLRHTFCTRYCEVETNIKVIQEIMGHADIATTMDVYNEATRDEKEASFERLRGKFAIC